MIPTPREQFRDVPVRRRAVGSRTDGAWVPGAVTERTVRASVQPARPQELLILPEGSRTRGAVVVYADTPLATMDEAAGLEAERVVYDGWEWEAQQVDRWGHGLAHWRAVCTRAEQPLGEPTAGPLVAPVLSAVRLVAGGAEVTWAPVPGATRYVVERAGPLAAALAAPPPARVPDSVFAEHVVVDAPALLFLDPSSAHPRGGRYEYRVRAASAAGRSLPSAAAGVEVP